MKNIVICGVTGQNGSFPGQSVFAYYYEAHGIVRSACIFNTARPDAIHTDRHEQRASLFVQQRYFRSTEFEFVVGDSVKASREVGRKPRVSFEGLVHRIIDYDLRLGKRERMVTAGDEIIQRGLWHG